MATTSTATYTFTRIEAVKLQFKHALLYASELDQTYVSLLLECVEKHYIDSVTFYGLNSTNQCAAEFTVRIDWAQFQVAVTADENIYLSSRTTNEGVSAIIVDWTEVYLQTVTAKQLKMKLIFRYTNEVLNDPALHHYVHNTLLRATYADAIVYANTFVTTENFRVREIPEMYGFVKI